MSLAVREKLQDRYEVVRSIKSGGMGAVYEAVDHKLASTPCAIKEVLASALEGSSAQYVLASFEAEMRALANLDHPNIPRVRDYFEIEGKRYIILDLVQGQGLDDELAEHLRLTHEPMDPAVAAVDMVQVLETLTYLHNCRPPIIHRDIKSANLIRDSRNGRIKLVDFGIARSVETLKVQTQVGTPGFCAPEQMAGRAELRSDLYSVGATLYHLCTGKLPPAFTFEALEMELPRAPGLVKIVLKATEPKPADRYANAEEMAQALRSWLRNEGSAKIDPAVLPREPAVTKINPLATAPMPANSQHGLWAAVLAMLLAAMGLLYSDYSSRFATPSPTPTSKPISTAPLQKPTAAPKPLSKPSPSEQANWELERRRLARERAELVEEQNLLRAERLRQQAAQRARPIQQPRAEVDAGYPHASGYPTAPRAEPSTPAPEGLRRTVNGPWLTTYDGILDGHRVTMHINKTGESALELRRNHAGKMAGLTEVPEREYSRGEYCGWRRTGNTHHGLHMKDGRLVQFTINPPPADSNTKVWGPVLNLIDRGE
ncbi:MAG: serine/threonine protein kinase [Candidatus Eremiobacteraeota bacterium]|nr:serine/threonine protein kinase [Candidatus Eremiobacteraeota bacterium]